MIKVDCDYIKGREEETLGYNPNVMGYPLSAFIKKIQIWLTIMRVLAEVDDIVSYLTKNFSEVDKNQSKLKEKKYKV